MSAVEQVDLGRWYHEPAAAYIASTLPHLASLDAQRRIEAALAEGVRLYRYKRKPVLPRVQRVIGFLRGVGPGSVLDIGSGRGAALWPMMDALPEARFACIDSSPQRASQLCAVARGWDRLAAFEGSAGSMPYADAEFDVVTALEVLEHMARPEEAAAEIARVCRRFVVVSVPSKPDDNPEHVRLFGRDSMRELLEGAGLRQLKFDGVPNHMIVVAQR
jgi:SAM-dependent methyltransferase